MGVGQWVDGVVCVGVIRWVAGLLPWLACRARVLPVGAVCSLSAPLSNPAALGHWKPSLIGISLPGAVSLLAHPRSASGG